MKRLVVLGSTGSIGESTLDVARAHPDRFKIVALSAHAREARLLEQADEFGVRQLCLSGAQPWSERISYSGEGGLLRMIEETDGDLVVNGVAGAAGLLPSFAAIDSGMHLALANKETLVMAGPLIRARAEAVGVGILPVDSEHSGLFMLLQAFRPAFVRELYLTASGGAFRDRPLEELAHVTVEEALAHPTWRMGPKITIDSASMANKGLEIIEARQLFDVPVDRIRVVMHPESVVHALVRTIDGSLYAQLSRPDMRLPIQNALTWPELVESPTGRLELPGSILHFREVDLEKYPMVALAFKVAGRGASYPIAYNAANEVAVAALVNREVSFLQIPRLVERVLEADWSREPSGLEDVLLADSRARQLTKGALV